MKLSTPVYVVAVGIAGVLDLLLASWFFSDVMVKDIAILPLQLRITDERNSIGFNTDDSLLTFGTMQAGGTGKRPVVLDNTYPYAVDVDYFASGNMSSWVYIENGTAMLDSGEEATIFVVSRAPMGTLPGEYGGNFHILFKRHFGFVSK
mgnify:CR=1 FL=1